jgi:hypothetical protein
MIDPVSLPSPGVSAGSWMRNDNFARTEHGKIPSGSLSPEGKSRFSKGPTPSRQVCACSLLNP